MSVPITPHPLASLIASGELRPASSRATTLLQALVVGGPYAGSAGLDALMEERSNAKVQGLTTVTPGLDE